MKNDTTSVKNKSWKLLENGSKVEVQISGFSNAGKETGESKKHKTIDYAKLTPYLVDTIQELIKK